jgi:hypothetical protein
LYFVPKVSCGKKSLNLVWSGGVRRGRDQDPDYL